MIATPYPVDPTARIKALQQALEVYAVRFRDQADRIEQLENKNRELRKRLGETDDDRRSE
jgi:hypothetical protein